MISNTYYVYIIECNDKTLYTGITNDLEKRINTHNKGKASKYTRARLPVKLLVFFEFPDRSTATKEEYRIKQLTKKEKLKLCKNN